MASVIRIKRSSGILAPSSLKTAEMAYTYGTGTPSNQGDRLFIGTGDDGSGNATSVTVIGGSYFTGLLDHTHGTLTASSAIVVDADRKVSQLLSGNIVIDGVTDRITGLAAPIEMTGAATKAYVDSATGELRSDLDSANTTTVANIRSDLDSATAELRSDLDSATAELRADLDSAVNAISPTFSFTGDAGSDTVTLADSSLRFQGIPGQMLAVVTDNRLQLGLQATNVTPGNYGSTTKIPTIEVDHYGRIDSIGEASIELTGGLGMDVTTTATGTTIAQTTSPLYSTLSSGVISSSGMTIPRLTIDETGRIQAVQLLGTQVNIGLIDSLGSNAFGATFTAGGAGYQARTIGVFGNFGIKSELEITNGSGGTPGRMAWNLSVDSAQLTGAVSGIAGGQWSADSNAIVLSTTDSNEFKIAIDDFGLNISSLLDATDSTHVVNKRQFDSGLASVQLDSATWDANNNTLNITLGGDLTSVQIDDFYDSLRVSGTVFADHFTRTNQVVDSGIYGGANAIPVITVNNSGLIDSIGTVSVESQITVEDSDSTAVIDFASHNLKITSPNFPAFGGVPTLDIKLDSNEFTIAMPEVNNTGHTPGGAKTYVGSGEYIPRLAIDKVGRVTGITTVQALPETAYLDTDYFAAQPFISNPLQALTLQGEQGIVTKITNGSTSTPSNTRFLFRLDSNISDLASLQVDNLKLDGNTLSSTDSSNQIFIDPFPAGDSGDLVVRGNLIVQGTQTTVNSSVVSLNDKNLVLADSAATANIADGAGITVGGDQFDSASTKPQFVFDAATYRWDPNLPLDIPYVSLDSAVFLNGVALREVMEDHLDNFFGVDSNNAVTITYDDVANTMTWKGTDASTTQKGVSSFDSSNFTITAGHVSVTVLDGGTY